jgi:plastocyanin
MRIAGLCLMFGATVLAGCSGGGDDPTPPPTPVFTTFTVEPSSIPALTVAGTQALTPAAKDQNGATMSGLTTTYISSASQTASVSPAGLVTGVALGTATITATGTIGSVTKTATVNVTVGAPPATVSVAATSGSQFLPANAVVARNGTVTWTFAIDHNVTFDTANSPANIGTTGTGSVSRTFPNAGTFAYHCTIHGGMTGTVTVQ